MYLINPMVNYLYSKYWAAIYIFSKMGQEEVNLDKRQSQAQKLPVLKLLRLNLYLGFQEIISQNQKRIVLLFIK